MTTIAAPWDELLRTAPLAPLGPGAVTAELLAWRHEGAGIPAMQPANRGAAELCVAGLLLMHNDLDGSHRISQNHEDATGSYWHAIMHRREPDPGNSKYWLRRIGQHPVLKDVQTAAEAILGDASPWPGLGRGSIWDPFRFVDICETLRDTGTSEEELARRVQLAECQALFEYTYRRAYA